MGKLCLDGRGRDIRNFKTLLSFTVFLPASETTQILYYLILTIALLKLSCTYKSYYEDLVKMHIPIQ